MGLAITVNFHYCGDHLAKISAINLGEQKECSCNPEAMPKGCCKDKLLVSKADNHYSSQNASTITNSSISIVPEFLRAINHFDLGLSSPSLNSGNSYKYVRRSCPAPIYLLIRVFRI